jgi:DNA topoisomerase-1
VLHDQGKAGKDYRSIKGEDDVLTIPMGRALELLAQPKMGRGRRGATPLRDLGPHPADQESIGLFEGKYGPYVKHGKTSASIPKDRDPATVTLDEAVEWIAARGGASAAARPARARKSPDPLTKRVKKAKRAGGKSKTGSAAKSGRKPVKKAARKVE